MRKHLLSPVQQTGAAVIGSLSGSLRGFCPAAISGGITMFIMVGLSLLLGVLPSNAAPSVPAPEFHIKTLEGVTYSKASLQGRPTLLVFWAPWCRYCQMELPILAKFYQGDNKPDQLQVLTIAFSDTRDHVEEYVTSHPDTFVFPTAYDQDNEVAKAFGVNATPTFVVMDPQGEMILAHRGAGINQNPQYLTFLKSVK